MTTTEAKNLKAGDRVRITRSNCPMVVERIEIEGNRVRVVGHVGKRLDEVELDCRDVRRESDTKNN